MNMGKELQTMLIGVVENIKQWSGDRGKAVMVSISGWGFRHTFFVDLNDEILSQLKVGGKYVFNCDLHLGGRNIRLKIRGVDDIENPSETGGRD